MSSGKSALSSELRDELIRLDGVRKIAAPPRSGSIFSPAGQADRLYLIESGFVKLALADPGGQEVILRFSGPGDLFGDDIPWAEEGAPLTAQAIVETVLHEIPRDAFLRAAAVHRDLWPEVAGLLAAREREMGRRLVLLSTRDVEFRILYSLAELAGLFGGGGEDCPLPVTQKELASYVGATRETTSSTLNAIARRGLLRLGRRLLVVPSLENLRVALAERSARNAASANV
jgi:CRP-like cAMP-binding protein